MAIKPGLPYLPRMSDESGDDPGPDEDDLEGGRRLWLQLTRWLKATPWWAVALLAVLVILCCLKGFSRAFG